MTDEKLVPDVINFISKCAEKVGAAAQSDFEVNEYCYCEDNGIKSPIEQILHSAFRTLMELNGLKESEPIFIENKPYIFGTTLVPQKQIGDYRVDFLAYYSSEPKRDGSQIYKEVIVECDSQQFHERTERERRYEKARDRFLQNKGYKIFHFTGKEIKDKPFMVAAEILAYLHDRSIEFFSVTD